MRLFTLSPRPALIAQLVPEGARLADIGTDHAFLPVYLIKTGKISTAIAVDINEKPLRRAAQTIERHNATNIRLVLGDGLGCISPQDADTIVIAGMGGDSIASILNGAAWAAKGEHLFILAPATAAQKLRAYLYNAGMSLVDEYIVREDRRLYPILVVRGRTDADCAYMRGGADEYCYFSRALIKRGGAEAAEYMKRIQNGTKKAILGLEKTGADAAAHKNLLAALEMIERERMK